MEETTKEGVVNLKERVDLRNPSDSQTPVKKLTKLTTKAHQQKSAIV